MAFKGTPETNDLRGSTSVAIARTLSKKYKNVFVFDPVIDQKTLRAAGFKTLPIRAGFKDADCVLVLNNHASFKELDIHRLTKTMRRPGLLFDGWSIFADSFTMAPRHLNYKVL